MAILKTGSGQKVDTSVGAGVPGMTYSAPSSPSGGGGAGNLVNPGSVFQTYNPNTGNTTYGQPTINYSGAGQAVATPTNLAGTGSPQVATAQGGFTGLSPDTAYVPDGQGGAILNTAGNAGYQMPAIEPVKIDDTISTDMFDDAGSKREVDITEDEATAFDFNKNFLRLDENGQYQNPEYLSSRDIQAEQNAIGIFGQTYGRLPGQDADGNPLPPAQATLDWQLVNNALYGQATPPGGGTLPGATDDPRSQVPAPPEVADDNGLIDIEKFTQKLMSDLDDINQEYIDTQNELIDYQDDTQQGTQAIGQELGTTVGLLQGEQRALQQQRALGENTLMRKLGIKEQEKANLIEKGQLQMQIEQTLYDRKRDIISDAKSLRDDQRVAFASMIDLMVNSGMNTESLTTDQVSWINKQASMFGMDAGVVLEAVDTVYADKLYNRQRQSMLDYNSMMDSYSDGGIEDRNDTQLKAQTFADRMAVSSDIITELETAVGDNLVGYVTGSDWYPNFLKTEERQRYEQAQRDFVNAVLRQESGAAIADSEFDSAAQQYFPQPGDSKAVIEQKRNNRALAISGMMRQAGTTSSSSSGDGDWSW